MLYSLLSLLYSLLFAPRKVDPPGIAPGSSVCRTDVFLLDHEPMESAAGVGIEPTPPGSEPGIATSSDYPAMCSGCVRRPEMSLSLSFVAPLQPSDLRCRVVTTFRTSEKNAMRESNPPVQLGRLTPLPIGQWHVSVAAAIFHTSNFTLQTSSKHPAGLEPALPPWRDGTLPLRYGCVSFGQKSLGMELNHRCRHIRTKCFRYTTERMPCLQQRVESSK